MVVTAPLDFYGNIIGCEEQADSHRRVDGVGIPAIQPVPVPRSLLSSVTTDLSMEVLLRPHSGVFVHM